MENLELKPRLFAQKSIIEELYIPISLREKVKPKVNPANANLPLTLNVFELNNIEEDKI